MQQLNHVHHENVVTPIFPNRSWKENLFEDILRPYIYNTIRYKEPNILYFIDKKEDH